MKSIRELSARLAAADKKRILLLAALIAIGYFVYHRYFYQAPEQEALPARVQVARAAYKDGLDTGLSSSASLQAIADVELKAKVEAPVQNIFARRNQLVRAQDVLVELEHNNASAKVISAQAQIFMNSAAAEAAKKTALNADAEWRRYERLIEQGAVARQDADDKRTASGTAAADYEQSLSAVNYARAELQAAEAELQDYFIRAPFDGVVLDDYDLTVGSKLKAEDSIVRLADVRVLKCSVMLPESKLGQVKQGMTAEVGCSSFPQDKFTGRIGTVNSFVDTATHTFRADVLIDNAALNYKLLPGMFAQVKILDETAQERFLCVPKEALSGDGTVLVVSDNKVATRKVEAGQSDGTHTAILSGLQEGEIVVTDGGKTLKTGDKVEYALTE